MHRLNQHLIAHPALLKAVESVASPKRSELIAQLFAALDTDQDGKCSSKDLGVVARQLSTVTGFLGGSVVFCVFFLGGGIEWLKQMLSAKFTHACRACRVSIFDRT